MLNKNREKWLVGYSTSNFCYQIGAGHQHFHTALQDKQASIVLGTLPIDIDMIELPLDALQQSALAQLFYF